MTADQETITLSCCSTSSSSRFQIATSASRTCKLLEDLTVALKPYLSLQLINYCTNSPLLTTLLKERRNTKDTLCESLLAVAEILPLTGMNLLTS